MVKQLVVGWIASTLCLVALQVSPVEAAPETVVYSFQNNGIDGIYPLAGLVAMKGIIYGTTGGGGDTGCDCGTVFSLDPSTGAETVLYSFCKEENCADGASPSVGSLIGVQGTLYGMTTSGGGAGCNVGCGTIYSLDPSTGAETVLYSFCSQQNCADGAYPSAGGLLNVKGTLYGSTAEGAGTGCGGVGCGAVFSFDLTTKSETIVYSFCQKKHCVDGAGPGSNLLNENGSLYGVTGAGGSGDGSSCGGAYPGCGTVFSINLGTKIESVVYSFCSQDNCADGANPADGLLDLNGTLYGTTVAGGSRNCVQPRCGTVFAINPSMGTEVVLHVFCKPRDETCGKGESPTGNLISVAGNLFGTTLNGGNSNCTAGCGTAFSMNPSTERYRVIHYFLGGATDGSFPIGAPLLNMKGVLYGTTEFGGSGCGGIGCGTVFGIAQR